MWCPIKSDSTTWTTLRRLSSSSPLWSTSSSASSDLRGLDSSAGCWLDSTFDLVTRTHAHTHTVLLTYALTQLKYSHFNHFELKKQPVNHPEKVNKLSVLKTWGFKGCFCSGILTKYMIFACVNVLYFPLCVCLCLHLRGHHRSSGSE